MSQHYTFTTLSFLKVVFLAIIYGALMSTVFASFTEMTFDTSTQADVPISTTSSGFALGVGNGPKLGMDIKDIKVNGEWGYNNNEIYSIVLQLFIAVIIFTFYGSMMWDFLMDGYVFMKQPTFIGGAYKLFVWGIFLSFISNFAFLSTMFVWLYFFILSIAGYWLSNNTIKTTFLNDFVNSYKNILELDIKRYDLIKSLKDMSVNNANKDSMDTIAEQVEKYYYFNNLYTWSLRFTENHPKFIGGIIFITFCFTSLMVLTSKFNSYNIIFYMLNIFLLMILLLGTIIFYYVSTFMISEIP